MIETFRTNVFAFATFVCAFDWGPFVVVVSPIWFKKPFAVLYRLLYFLDRELVTLLEAQFDSVVFRPAIRTACPVDLNLKT